MEPANGRLAPRPIRRLSFALVLSLSLTAACVLGLFYLGRSGRANWLAKWSVKGATDTHAFMASCKSANYTGSTDLWETAQARYRSLRDDKFTIAIQTYHREKELGENLDALLGDEIPSLLEIFVVWKDVETAPPGDFDSPRGVPVRYRRSKRNSLNEKLWPDPTYQTQAILLSDDDVYYRPDDLEFVFQVWCKFGRHRLTGALARCATPVTNATWEYGFCSHKMDDDAYSMILTNLAFTHISLIDYYHSDDPAAQKMRDYVDKHFNCEDIALKYLASLLTGDGSLLVQGHERYVNMEPAKGISKKPNHLEARSQCLHDLADVINCMPLVNETARVERGVVVL